MTKILPSGAFAPKLLTSLPILTIMGDVKDGRIVRPNLSDIGQVDGTGSGGANAAIIKAVESAMANGDEATRTAIRRRANGLGGCALQKSTYLPDGCVQDECGRVFIRAGGRLIKVSNPETIREKFLMGSIPFTADTAGGELSLELKPQIDFFVPQRVSFVLLGGVTAVGVPFNLENIFLTSLAVGTNNQQSNTLGSASSVNATIAGNLAHFSRDATDTRVELDVSTPNKTILFKFSYQGPTGPDPIPNVVLSVMMFGLTFDGAALPNIGAWRHRTEREGFPMLRIELILAGFTEGNPSLCCELISSLVCGMAAANAIIMRASKVPPLYESGIRYRQDPPGREVWLDCKAMLQVRFTDCNNLVAYRIGELSLQGRKAYPVVTYQRNGRGGYTFHVTLVEVTGDSAREEDPSAILGMNALR